MDDDHETYILLLLSDSNLPTGSFVASSGLESFVKHGFAPSDFNPTDFIRDSLQSYGRSAIPFVSDAHRIVDRYRTAFLSDENVAGIMEETLGSLTELDMLYDAMTLNHVARRASKAQGVALLTLYSKGFSRPSSLSAFSRSETRDQDAAISKLIDCFKLMVRRGEVSGHLPTCWGILTAALYLGLGVYTHCSLIGERRDINGLSAERAQYLHLFLHARSLLSASIRLNDIGPYGAQQILLHVVRPLVVAETSRCQKLRTGILDRSNKEFEEIIQGPANTWPLGEILAARHDLQHSRIFNS